MSVMCIKSVTFQFNISSIHFIVYVTGISAVNESYLDIVTNAS